MSQSRTHYRIYYEDTDFSGSVYHANYLKFMERARTEFIRARGLDYRMLRERGIQFVMRDVSVRYKKPATLDDEICVQTELLDYGAAKLTFVQTIFLADTDTVLSQATVEVVCVNNQMKPMKLPELVKRSLCES